MDIELPELGYTPKNLQTLRARYGLTQTQVAEIVGIKNYVQVSRWEREPDEGGVRADMPLEKWRALLAHLADK